MSKTYKVYREGNYIRVIDTLTNELFNGAIKEVFVDKSNVQKNEYTISKVKDFNEAEVLLIGNILKQDNTAYSISEWETFYTTNTGNFNGGGSAPDLSGFQLTSQKNQNNGYSGLDSGGKVPLQNLPTTLLQYIGVYNVATNTPPLTNNDITRASTVYTISGAGDGFTRFDILWKNGDWLIYNANGIVEKSDNSDDVVSVNGQTGVVTLTLQSVLDLGNESTTGVIVNTNEAVGVIASGNYAGVNASGGNIGVIALGGNTGVNTTGQVFGVIATGNTQSAGIFNIPSENSSNIVQFTKNNIRQASISHDGKIKCENIIANITSYSNDAAADADSSLQSGSFYKLTGSRQIFQKP